MEPPAVEGVSPAVGPLRRPAWVWISARRAALMMTIVINEGVHVFAIKPGWGLVISSFFIGKTGDFPTLVVGLLIGGGSSGGGWSGQVAPAVAVHDN